MASLPCFDSKGMDYPDVSFVLQVGIPQNREQYIHRVGRTARAGKPGYGLLLLADFETVFLDKIKDLSLTKSDFLDTTTVCLFQDYLPHSSLFFILPNG